MLKAKNRGHLSKVGSEITFCLLSGGGPKKVGILSVCVFLGMEERFV